MYNHLNIHVYMHNGHALLSIVYYSFPWQWDCHFNSSSSKTGLVDLVIGKGIHTNGYTWGEKQADA